MQLRKLSETATKITLEHDPVPGAAGFRISPVVKAGVVQEGKWAHTFDGDRTQHTFAAGFPPYRVEALSVLDAGVYTGDEPPPPPASGMVDRSYGLFRQVAGGLPVVETTLANFRAPEPGKRVVVQGNGTLSSAALNAITRARLASPGTVEFVGDARVTQELGWNVQNLAVWGLDVTAPKFGSRPVNCRSFRWWGGKIHGCGSTGIHPHGALGPNVDLDLALEIWSCGLDLSNDPHGEPGTGLHAAYIGARNGGGTTQGKFWLMVHDQPRGAAAQLGDAMVDSELWVDARRCSFMAQSQVAGNALQWWGGGIRNNVVRYVYGEDLAGRLSETNGGAGSGNRIEVGRYRNVCLNPRLRKGTTPTAAEVCAPGVPCADLQAV